MTDFLSEVSRDLFEGAIASAADAEERKAAARRELAKSQERAGAAARRIVAHLAKNAARRYRKRPAYLDAIAYDLSYAHPEMIIARVREESAKARRMPWGKVEIVPVVAINHAGAIIFARWLRRFGERADALATAAE